MTRTLASLFGAAFLTLAPTTAALAEATHGGAIPNNFSSYESSEFADIQYASGRDAAPVWGSVVLEGGLGVRFVPDNGAEVKVAYGDIQAIRYERVVKEKEKKAEPVKWYQKPFSFARGVETYRLVTIEHRTAENSKTVSQLRTDEVNANGIIRLLELKTGLRVKRLSSL